jgi:hypothetical protein
VRRVAFKKGATPLGGSHAFALPSCIAPFHLPSPRMGRARVAFVLLLLEEWAAASHLEFVVPQALRCGGLFVPAGVEPEFRL